MVAPISEEFRDAINFSKSKLGVADLNLKEKQFEALHACYEGHDCVAVLPTGYGKSLIFQILPWILQKKYKKSEAMIVIVVSPLNSIMQDQVVGLVEKRIKACYLNYTGSAAKTYEIAHGEEKGDPDDEFIELETPVYTEKSVSLPSLKNGDYKPIYAHPETLMSNSVIGRMLRSKIYKEQVGCIAIDEVHLVADWGQQFRKDFQKPSELNALFTDAVHIVVTATLTPISMNILIKDLQLRNPTVIKTNPDRINIYIEKKTRLPNVRKFDKFDDLIEPLFLELKLQRASFQ